MKAVISTVRSAEVTVDGETVGKITRTGLLALVGVGRNDDPDAWRTMARKIAELRILPEPPETGETSEASLDAPRNCSAQDLDAPILLVSQFTLMGATAKGRRPSWTSAAAGDQAEPVIDNIADELRSRGLTVETGRFGAMMEVSSVNLGPFTVLVEC